MANGYYSVMRVTDYGPYITKLILPIGDTVTAAQVSAEKFCVYAERLDDEGVVLRLPKSWMARDDREPSRGYVPLTDATSCDRDGTPREEGRYIALSLAYGPLTPITAAICAPNGVNVYIHNRFVVTQTADIAAAGGVLGGRTYDCCLGRDEPDMAGWLLGKSEGGTLPLRYGYFVPETTQPKKPLIVWLHGAGEGGFDTRIPFTGNKVVALAKPAVQRYFGGAYIFAPQCDTFWMNDGSGKYGHSGKSVYADALMDAIECFIARHTDIDCDRVYIGGDSNGGFMTMRMILDHPDFFAAAFPVCEALYDDLISDVELAGVRCLPIWFTHAKNDPVVNPAETVAPTFERLKRLDAPVHFTFWDGIRDVHEGFRGADGKPYEYFGHFAWIPVFNDDCKLDADGSPVTVDGREVGLLEWLGMQRR